MRAITYQSGGDASVLSLEDDKAAAEPGEGEVRVRIVRSGVNPTDWKSRTTGPPAHVELQVPGQDGAGVVESVGAGVDPARVGERVWVWEAAYQRPEGTAQELCVVPARQAVALPDEVSLDHGACLGIPALTAHRLLTCREDGPSRLSPGALSGVAVLVHGGAGAVGHAAIQLARWAGATVLTTVSSDDKAALARAAGAEHVVDYTREDVEARVREVAPDGVALVCEVAPAVNAGLDLSVCAQGATVAFYANDKGDEITVPIRPSMVLNLRWQAVMVYTVAAAAKDDAVAAVDAALRDGALAVGEDHGMPLHHVPMTEATRAHELVEGGAVGKVLIDVSDDASPGRG